MKAVGCSAVHRPIPGPMSRQSRVLVSGEEQDTSEENGYDEAMGARPLARLIQQTIKTPLADEVLFGRLKSGGAVKVMVVESESGIKVLGLEYPAGPVTPKPDPDVAKAAEKRKKTSKTASSSDKPAKPRGKVGSGGGRKEPLLPQSDAKSAKGAQPVRSVPKVPLTKA